MGEMGLLAPDVRTELINGEIIDMTPPGSRHCAIVTYLTHALTAAVDLNAKHMTRCRKPRDGRYEEVVVMTAAELREPVATLSGFRIELPRLFELDQ
jgi:Uma2 family endonuclease